MLGVGPKHCLFILIVQTLSSITPMPISGQCMPRTKLEHFAQPDTSDKTVPEFVIADTTKIEIKIVTTRTLNQGDPSEIIVFGKNNNKR